MAASSAGSLADRVRLLVDHADNGNVAAAAKRAGIPVATLDRIVRGVVTNPRRDALERLAKAYRLTIDDLLSGPRVPPTVRIADGVEAIAEALRLWAALVYDLRLPDRELENAMQALPLTFDDFCDLLHMGGDDFPDDRARDEVQRARAAVIHSFRDALRIAIDLHGVDAVRAAIIARGDAIRLRLSHYVEGLTTPGLLPREQVLQPGQLENIGKATNFGPIFAEGSFELRGGVPAPTRDESWPLVGDRIVDAMKETHRHGQPASDDDLPPHRRPVAKMHHAPKKKRRRSK